MTEQEAKIVRRHALFQKAMVMVRLATLFFVILIVIGGQLAYAQLAKDNEATDQKIVQLIEKLTYERQQSQIRNEESHGEMTAFIKCIALIVSARGHAVVTNGELESCEVQAQQNVIKPSPQPGDRTAPGSPGGQSGNSPDTQQNQNPNPPTQPQPQPGLLENLLNGIGGLL